MRRFPTSIASTRITRCYNPFIPKHFTRAAAAALIAAACVTVGARQPEIAAMSRRAAARLQALREEADRLSGEERTLLVELRRLDVERQIKAEELTRAEAEVDIANGQIASVDRQIRTLEQQEVTEGPQLRARLVNLYKLGRGRYVRLLLSTSSLRQLGQASRMVAAVAAQDRARVASHQRRIAELAASRDALQARQRQIAELRAAAERAKVAADRAIEARNARIHDIDARRDLNAELAGELQAAQQKLQATLGSVAAGAATDAAFLPIRPFRGALAWPVEGTVRQRFGRGAVAVNGIDIAVAEGRPVHAVHDGMVAFADAFTGFGKLVIVDHGAQSYSLYGNLADVAVLKGARVVQGDVIGAAGVSPTGAAGLYFELRVDGRAVDPLLWLQRK